MGRLPAVAPLSQRQYTEYRMLHFLHARAVTFIDDKDVTDFHDARLERLDVVAHSGNENDDRNVGEFHNVDFVLPDADSFDDDWVFTRSIENSCDIGSCCCQPTQMAARCHAAK